MNCSLKILSFLALITLVAGLAFITVERNTANQGQLTSLARPQQQTTQTALDTLPAAGVEGSSRSKRAIVFRPLFVYRQQQVQKQRLKEEREQKAQAAAAAATAAASKPKPVKSGSRYAPGYYYNSRW